MRLSNMLLAWVCMSIGLLELSGCAVVRAPGIAIFEYHTQTKRERERDLRQLRRNGGVCLTSYGIIVNNSEQLATDTAGREFIWVRNRIIILAILYSGWT